jgi:phosphoribosylaminoimidazolecarboxamide formyltransferase/IMP cyclohydrolase
MESPRIERALISVSDKSGLIDFARGLVDAGVELFSTGGTRRTLNEAGLEARDIAEYTGWPEMMDGRVKTLHPRVHGGVLGRLDQPDDKAAMAEHGIVPFELVVVNLYPFEDTISRPETTFAEAVEQIDVGGPTLVRAAAKNHLYVTIASDPSQYNEILESVRRDRSTSYELRKRLAGAAFAHTAGYDSAIATYFARQLEPEDEFPRNLRLRLDRKATLRYGENPHQEAAYYAWPTAGGTALVNAEQLHGKELSYNNLLDLDAAWRLVRLLPAAGVAVLKHNNPCGAASAPTVGEAIQRAWEGDPVSAFGSILGFNVPVDESVAEFLAEPGKFVEAIVAPDFTPGAVEILTTRPKWKANVRLLRTGELTTGQGDWEFRSIDGGLLVQRADDGPDQPEEWQTVTETAPESSQLADLRFAWAVCRHVKSNAIVLVKDQTLLGVGAGQMSRVDSVNLAISKAQGRAQGSVLASDAFFPFDDSVHLAAAAGVSALVQPGGSVRDSEVISACNQHKLPHFRH